MRKMSWGAWRAVITCITYNNLHLTGRAFSSQFILRHKAFIERQSYNVRTYQRREYDQYDTPATIYLVYESASGTALGVSRLMPAEHACMLRDLWPELIADSRIPDWQTVWEGTRFCIDSSLPPSQRAQIKNELVLAYLELGLHMGISHIVGLMPRYILRAVFQHSGVEYQPLGPVKDIDGIKTQAAVMAVTYEQLQNVRKITNITSPVLDSSCLGGVTSAAA